VSNTLQGNFATAARSHPAHAAVVEPAVGTISYAELDELSDLCRDRLVAWGVQPGDRIGLCLRKSINSVAAILGR